MRAHDKKKVYRLMIKKNVRAGLINDASGSWRSNAEDKSMGRDLRAGHRSK